MEKNMDIPEGWQLVPIVPIPEQMDDAFEGISLSEAHTTYGVTEHVWAHMLKNAPQICQNCMGEGVDGEPGDGLLPDAMWTCETCNGAGRLPPNV